MIGLFRSYAHWLHLRWPAGAVEPLPAVDERGRTNLPGVWVTGDLTGVPLLKFALDSGARAVEEIVSEPGFRPGAGGPGAVDLAIVGAGVSGMAAAVEAKRLRLSFTVLEAADPFSTILNFPKAKPIYTYPVEMRPRGDLQVTADVKESLVEELTRQVKAHGIRVTTLRIDHLRLAGGLIECVPSEGEPIRAQRVIVAIGRSGNFRKLGVPGEDLPKVYNRLHDPKDFCGRNALVVGGGDSALETAIALALCGAHVTLSYRKEAFIRPKAENVEKLKMLVADPAAPVAVERPTSERVTTAAGGFLDGAPGHGKGSVRLALGTTVKEIRPDTVVLRGDGGEETIPNDVVFAMIGRDPPLGFFRRSGIRIRGEMTWASRAAFAAFLLFCVWLFNWKSGGSFWFPVPVPAPADPSTLLGVVAVSASQPAFWYTLAYSALVCVFGVRRYLRRRTPYVAAQTATLAAIQVVPLFLLPEVILPYLGRNGYLPEGLLDALFPEVSYGHGREYWRAYGFILAWPLMVYNVFTDAPIWGWLAISAVQTFVLIPALIYRFGKGAYCGWICSCGALAETLGDAHRQKMPHGPVWNRLNMAGQAILAVCLALLVVRIYGWTEPWDSPVNAWFREVALHHYKWIVDVGLAGIVGVGVYFWYSGRVWCRFFCPLAALMHIYARFSTFAILAEKKRCISCNVCTSVCHQGIDVMNFANKGEPMVDPECVRCSACVQSCPTAVLSFGRVRGGAVIGTDRIPARAA